MNVIRTNTEHLCVGDKWFLMKDLMEKVWSIVSKQSDNPAFDFPPWFYTGSPYGEDILNLNVKECEPPKEYSVVCVPKVNITYHKRIPNWPAIFNTVKKD